MKTDEGFNRNDYKEIDIGRETILKTIPNSGCISNVPLDCMHLVLLGVLKRLIRLWIKGPFKVKLTTKQINKISKKLVTLLLSAPAEFGRRPRSFRECSHWKATKYRTFLLYTSVVVFKNIIREDMYQNFLFLHTAISVLCSEIHLQFPSNIPNSHKPLVRFIEGFQKIYGKEYVSHNIHNLLHLCPDVGKFVNLDKFSSFRFENYLSSVKKWIRKGHQPLQQIAKRYYERKDTSKDSKILNTTILELQHNSGPLVKDITVQQQYKIKKNKTLKLNCWSRKTFVFYQRIEPLVKFSILLYALTKHT